MTEYAVLSEACRSRYLLLLVCSLSSYQQGASQHTVFMESGFLLLAYGICSDIVMIYAEVVAKFWKSCAALSSINLGKLHSTSQHAPSNIGVATRKLALAGAC